MPTSIVCPPPNHTMPNALPKGPDSIQQRLERRQRFMKVVRYGVFLPSIIIGALSAIGMFIWPSATIVETGKTAQYADIQPQFLDATVPQIIEAIQQESNAHPKRLHFDADRMNTHDASSARLNLVAHGPYIPTDVNILVTIHTSQRGKTVVNMRASGSGGGKTDFGQKARNVRYLQDVIASYEPPNPLLHDKVHRFGALAL